jgi:DNA repair photolyase
VESVTRKSLLYKSGLGFPCVNHVQGCSHGCAYPCYAYMMARSYGRAASMEEWRRPRLVANARELLERELSRARQKPDSVSFCLTTDPFMVGYPEVAAMSLDLIAICNAHGVACSVLTKGVLPIELADRGRFPSDNVFGSSLVSLNEGFRARWEPGAAPYAERVAALRALHDAGCRTLVHMEPYPTPNLLAQDLKQVLGAIDFVDSLYFGGWNYNRQATTWMGREAFYHDQAELAQAFCEERGIGFDRGAP